MKKLLMILSALSLATQVSASVPPLDKDWEQISNGGGIRVWRKEIEGSPIVAFKGEAVVNASIAKVATVLKDSSRKLEWVAKIVEAKDIRQINEFERIEYNHTGTPIILKDRDFVFHCKAEFDKEKKQMLIKLHSVQDPAMPETKFVRGQLMESSYTLTSIENGTKTHIIVEIHADPMGSVAKWIVNLFQKSWPRKTLEGIQKQAMKADVVEDPLTKKYLAL